MPHREDAGLEVALQQRRQLLERWQMELAVRDRALLDALGEKLACEARLRAAEGTVASRIGVPKGSRIDPAELVDAERVVDQCARVLAAQEARVTMARQSVEATRSEMQSAHQAVRAIEVVLEARATRRAEAAQAREAREASEIAANVHERARRAKALEQTT